MELSEHEEASKAQGQELESVFSCGRPWRPLAPGGRQEKAATHCGLCLWTGRFESWSKTCVWESLNVTFSGVCVTHLWIFWTDTLDQLVQTSWSFVTDWLRTNSQVVAWLKGCLGVDVPQHFIFSHKCSSQNKFQYAGKPFKQSNEKVSQILIPL